MQRLEIHTDPGVDTHVLVQEGRGERGGSQLQHPVHEQKQSSWSHSISSNIGPMNLEQRNSVLRLTLPATQKRGEGKKGSLAFIFHDETEPAQGYTQLKTGSEHHVLENDREEGSTLFLCDSPVLLCLRSGIEAAKKPQNCGWLGCIGRQACFL